MTFGRSCLWFGLLVLTPACVSVSDGDRMERQILELQKEVASIQAAREDDQNDMGRELDDTVQRIAVLEGTLRGLRQSDADNGIQMEKVITELQTLRGEAENIRYQLGETRTELGDTKTQLGETQKTVQDIINRPPPSVQAEVAAPSVPLEEKKPSSEREAIPADMKAHYALASNNFKKKEYVQAILAFD